jgi:hypothetical protein
METVTRTAAWEELQMSDNYPTETGEVRKYGMRGVVSTGAGIGLILFNSLLHVPVLGIILGGGLVVLGVMGLIGKNRTDKTTGTVLIVAGALGLASFLFKGVTGFILGTAGLGLIGFGVFSLFKFARGLKARS